MLKRASISIILCYSSRSICNSRNVLQAEIVRILTKEKESLILTGHTGYVQGVAWDPLDEMVVTQSADRTCKVHMVSGWNRKLKSRGRTEVRYCGG